MQRHLRGGPFVRSTRARALSALACGTIALAPTAAAQRILPGQPPAVSRGAPCDDPTFAAPQFVGTGSHPRSVAIGDIDGDGDLDLVVANGASGSVSVLRNQGNGAFDPHVPYAVGDWPSFVALGDLDGDGDLDLAVANTGSYTVSVLLNDGGGVYGSHVEYATPAFGSWDVAVADLDGDGDRDLAVVNRRADNQGTVSVLLNHGNGTFAPQVEYLVEGWPHHLALGDLDADGDQDIVVALSTSIGVGVLLNNGDATFAPRVSIGIGLRVAVDVADLDRDGDVDIVVAAPNDDGIYVLRNDGGGQFPTEEWYASPSAPGFVSIGEVDGDGVPDVCVLHPDHDAATVLYGRDDQLTASGNTWTGPRPLSVALGDIDGDGDVDLAVVTEQSDRVAILFQECR